MKSMLLFEDTSKNLEAGFLANKILEILQENRKISVKDKLIIKSGLKFLNHAKAGREQVNSGKLKNDAILAIDAYTRAIFAYNQLFDKDEKREFEEIIKIVISELDNIINTNETNPSENQIAITFFMYLRKYSIHKLSQSRLTQQYEGSEWNLMIS